MMFIIDGILRFIHSHNQFINLDFNLTKQISPIFFKVACCIAAVPVGISYSDGEK